MYRSYRELSSGAIWVLIGLNLLLFIATAINQELIFYLGLQPASFTARPWTIVTSLFVHASLWHIIANMLTLYFFGRYVCSLIGESRFLILYFGGGILGSIFYILLGPPLSIAIGASGAVFAVAGVLTVIRPRLRVFVFPIPAPLPLWVAVIGGFLIISFLPFVAWQAHLGGLIVGLVDGYFLRKRERHFF